MSVWQWFDMPLLSLGLDKLGGFILSKLKRRFKFIFVILKRCKSCEALVTNGVLPEGDIGNDYHKNKPIINSALCGFAGLLISFFYGNFRF